MSLYFQSFLAVFAFYNRLYDQQIGISGNAPHKTQTVVDHILAFVMSQKLNYLIEKFLFIFEPQHLQIDSITNM